MKAVRLVHAKRARGIPVRTGAVRQARFESGLTLAAVAGDELTRAAIHLIEAGKSRPSMATLRLIAERTGKPITFFLEEAALQQGERPAGSPDVQVVDDLVEREEYGQAISVGQAMLQVTAETGDRARLDLAIAIAHLKQLEPDKTLNHVGRALVGFELVNDAWMRVECLDWQAFALHLNHHPSALALGEEALRRCRDLDPIPSRTEARILSHLGTMHLHHHHWEQGLGCLEAALSASTALRDLTRMAIINHDLAVALANLGRFSEALPRASRALNLYSMLRQHTAIAALENDIGMMKFDQGDMVGAYGNFLSSMAHYEAAGVERRKSHTLLSLAALHQARGSDYEAEQACHEAAKLAERLNEHRNLALAHEYLGQVAARRRDHARADAEFGQAISILEANGAIQRAIECRSAYADVLEERGDLTGANRQLRAALNNRPRPAAVAELRSATA